MSVATRCPASSVTSRAGARSQPTRRPAQCVLLIEPTVTTWTRFTGSRMGGEGRGRGDIEGEFGERLVDDEPAPARRAACRTRPRSPSGMRWPVGLWKSGTR